MRIRSIRPEFWSSEDIAAMDWHTRLVYIGLWSYVDDNGVGRDNDRLIVADLFPLDEDFRESSRRVTGALQYLSDHNHITRYRVDDKPFLHINKWLKHQRIEKASKGRYPLPACENAEIQEPSRNTPGTLPDMSTPGEGEKGRRGEGEKNTSDVADAPSSSAIKIADPTRPDVTRICEHLADSIEANGSKRPTITTRWETSARLMLDRDNIREEDIHAAIDWSQNDDFWRSNILSLPKLRDKYDQLRLQAQRRPQSRRGDIDWDAAAERARLIDQQNGAHP